MKRFPHSPGSPVSLALLLPVLVLSGLLTLSRYGAAQDVRRSSYRPFGNGVTETLTPAPYIAPVTDTLTPTLTPTPTRVRNYFPLARLDPTQTPTLTPTTTLTPTATPPGIFPPFTTSYYVMAFDSKSMYDLGCFLGNHDLEMPGKQDDLVILDFGMTYFKDGVYGAYTMSLSKGPVTLDQVANAVEQYAWGYYNCTGADYDSHLRIAVGVNNHTSSYTAVNFAHGARWADMVNRINAWLVDPQQGASGQVDVVGANDIELSWNSYAHTIDWLNGYDSTNWYDMINFGALEGCPRFSNPNAQCGDYGEGYLWSLEQVWQVIFGAPPIYPLPEIFLTNGVHAQQWYLFSVYSFNNHGYPISFAGSLTNYKACVQMGCSGSEYGIDNTPYQGWYQLASLLKADPRTYQNLRFTSDMCWQVDSKLCASIAVPTPAGAMTLTENGPGLQALLSSGALSAADRSSLQEKLAIQQREAEQMAQGKLHPGAKDPARARALPVLPTLPPLPFDEGISDGSDGWVRPSEADIQNLWRGSVDGQKVMVLAGSLPEEDAGLVVVFKEDASSGEAVPTFVRAPAGAGALRIFAREGNLLRLITRDGSALLFDISTGSFR